MLFNSHQFIFAYLPIVFAGFFILAAKSRLFAALWLACASLMFYAWWSPRYVALLLASICFNFAVSLMIGRFAADGKHRASKVTLCAAISADLALLAYYKYADFFVASTNNLVGTSWPILDIVLPLGISFYTFTQLAFLIDVYRGIAREYNFVHYLLFVTYFPHLIAGPVLHHKQMMPQFAQAETYRMSWENVSIGLTFFSIGLAKKVLLADNLAGYATPMFDAAAAGREIGFFSAWVGLLAYSFQLYFDFSGYSDMAVGLSILFGVKLPFNFDSPYKSHNIIDFWKRWHMTLSQFLLNYLYIPLGGNRKSKLRRYVNLMVTMLLGGLWHGSNWTFVAWGGLHGVYLCVCHGWRSLSEKRGYSLAPTVSVAFTFVAVTVSWAFFRADSFASALNILQGMLGLNGFTLPMSMERYSSWVGAISPSMQFRGLFSELDVAHPAGEVGAWLVGAAVIVWATPNSQCIVEKVSSLRARHAQTYAAIYIGALFAVAVLSMNRLSEFLYFQF